MEGLLQLNQLSVLGEIDRLKSEIDALHPLSREQEGRIMQKFRLDWNYHSNAIEGNSLNYGETVAFLMHGITAKGKPFKDYLDIRGHNNAIDYLLDLVRGNDSLTETDIRNLHELVLGEPYETDAVTPDGQPTKKRIIPGKYKTTPNQVKTSTGEIHYYASPEETPAKMGDLMSWYREASTTSALHPVVVAALFHHRFVSIHPFDDGNGRMTRLLMNLMLMQRHYPPTVTKQQDRGVYYLTLSQADAGDDEPFVQFIAENVKAGLELYLKGARGESLDEPSDLDKELALFKIEVKGKEAVDNVKRTIEDQQQSYKKSFKPAIDQIRILLGKVREFFKGYKEELNIGPYIPETYQQTLNASTAKAVDSVLEQVFNKPQLEKIFLHITVESYRYKPTFDLKITFIFTLSDYKYTLNVTLYTKSAHFNWDKQYNDYIDHEEINDFISKIGKDILGLLRTQVDKSPS